MNKRPLSILIVYDCLYPDSIGGIEHRNYYIAEELSKRGHDVIRAGWKNHSPDSGTSIHEMRLRSDIYGPNGKRSTIASLKFAIACLSLPLRRYDVIETANIPYTHLIPFAIRCALARKPLVITWHEYWGPHWRTYVGRGRAPVFSTIERIAAQLGRSVSAVSALTANRLRVHRRGCVHVPIIPCGIALEQIRSAAADVQRDRSTLVYAGRLMAEKRLELAIEALMHTRHVDGVPVLKIIGDGPDRPRLEELVHRLGLSERVRFTGRLASSEEVWREIARARIAVQPSSREGFGMFPLEALACGTPVVYCESPESAISGLITDGKQGFCASATPHSMAEKIDVLLRSDEVWKRMSESGIELTEGFRWETIGESVETLLYEALGR